MLFSLGTTNDSPPIKSALTAAQASPPRPEPRTPRTHRGRSLNRLRPFRRASLVAVGLLAILAPVVMLNAQAASSPSGMAMPGDYTSWKLTFSDDFNGSAVDSTKWGVYNGIPKGGVGRWDKSMTIVSGGMLILRAQKVNGEWLTGGVSNARAGSQKYGKWAVRFRISAANGIGYALLLYPGNGGWPPEVDFAEDGGGTRQSSMATLHWAPGNQQVHNTLKVDNTAWHTMGVVVAPGSTKYPLAGARGAPVRGNPPAVPMWLGMQTQVKTCQAKYSGTCMSSVMPSKVDLDIDWVARWTAK